MHDKILAQIETLVEKGYSRDKIYHILSEEYEDKGTIRLIVDNVVIQEDQDKRNPIENKMIAIAVAVMLVKLVWNATGGYGIAHEIHLTTLFIMWAMYSAIKKCRFENLAIAIWVFTSVEVLYFKYKPNSEIFYLLGIMAMSIIMTVLAFQWKKGKDRAAKSNE